MDSEALDPRWGSELLTAGRWSLVIVGSSALIVAATAVLALYTWRQQMRSRGELPPCRAWTLREWLRMLLRRKWAFIILAVLGLVLAGLVWAEIPATQRFLHPKYRALALVRRKDLAVLTAAPESLIAGGSSLSDDTLRVEILTWTNLDRVLRQTKLDLGLSTPADLQRAYEDLRESISIGAVAQDRGVHQIQIEVVSEYPEEAAAVANAIADSYVEESKRTIRVDSQSVLEFYQRGRDEYLDRLREIEQKLDEYRHVHFAELPEVKTGILQRLFDLRIEQAACRSQVNESRSRLEELDKQMAAVPYVVTVAAAYPNPRVAELQARIAQLREQLDGLLLQQTDTAPAARRMREDIARAEAQLAETPFVAAEEGEQPNPAYQELLGRKLDLERQVEEHETALSGAEAQSDAIELQLRTMQDEERSYNDLLRDHEEITEAYDTYRRGLLAARTRVEVEQDPGYGTQVEMVARALVPAFPYATPHKRMAVLLFGAGLLFGLVLAGGLTLWDRLCEKPPAPARICRR